MAFEIKKNPRSSVSDRVPKVKSLGNPRSTGRKGFLGVRGCVRSRPWALDPRNQRCVKFNYVIHCSSQLFFLPPPSVTPETLDDPYPSVRRMIRRWVTHECAWSSIVLPPLDNVSLFTRSPRSLSPRISTILSFIPLLFIHSLASSQCLCFVCPRCLLPFAVFPHGGRVSSSTGRTT